MRFKVPLQVAHLLPTSRELLRASGFPWVLFRLSDSSMRVLISIDPVNFIVHLVFVTVFSRIRFAI